MKKIIAYQLLLLAFFVSALISRVRGGLPSWVHETEPWMTTSLIGGLGGVVYCLRGVYLNACVRGKWEIQWEPWYYIRPVVSVICGAISCLFLKAGLLVLEADKDPQAANLGFYALAFIAGLNVDKFVAKLEDLAHATWGIEKSRTAATSATGLSEEASREKNQVR